MMSEDSDNKMAGTAYQDQKQQEDDDKVSMEQNEIAPSNFNEIIGSNNWCELMTTEEEGHDNNSLNLLATVASATQQGNYEEQNLQGVFAASSSGGSKLLDISAQTISQDQEHAENPWHTVAIAQGESFDIECYLPTSNDTRINNFSDLPQVALNPDTAYKIEGADVNSCDQKEWSKPSLFKTPMWGLPKNPRNIKIIKTPYGVTLSWDKPINPYGQIKEYCVWLGVLGCDNNQKKFVQVYCGARPNCFVPNSVLNTFDIQPERGENVIVFRVSASNEIGYGPASQVKLEDK